MWRVCERLKMRPPGIKEKFEDCDVWTQASLVAYENIREHEEDGKL
jgi:hypothetical protein